jgi:hypothetical protein
MMLRLDGFTEAFLYEPECGPLAVLRDLAFSRRRKYAYAPTVRKLIKTAMTFQIITGRDPINSP